MTRPLAPAVAPPRPRALISAALLAATTCAAPAPAAQTIRYTYDARGRLITVARTGGPAPATTRYIHDRADNRTRKTTTTP